MALDLGKQVGPLPLGAWVAVVGVGGAIAYQSRGGSGGTEYVEDGSTDPGVGMGGGAVGWLPVAPITSDASIGGGIETNEDWQREATNYLIAENYDPAKSTRAISKYLNEERLGIQERALLTIALRRYGPPPAAPRGPFGGIPAPPPTRKKPTKKPSGKKPADKPTSNKPNRSRPKPGGDRPERPNENRDKDTGGKNANVRYHTVRPGNTLSSIALKYYGNPQEFRQIYQANKQGSRRADGTAGILTNPNLVMVGQKLIIP